MIESDASRVRELVDRLKKASPVESRSIAQELVRAVREAVHPAGVMEGRRAQRGIHYYASPSEMYAEVTAVLRQDASLRDRNIHVGGTAPGIIELTGRVADQDEVDRAIALAKTVLGVKAVLVRFDRGGAVEGARSRTETDSTIAQDEAGAERSEQPHKVIS